MKLQLWSTVPIGFFFGFDSPFWRIFMVKIEGYHYDWHFRGMVFQTIFFLFLGGDASCSMAISAGVSNFKNRTGFKSQNLRWPIHESFDGKETDP